MPYPIISQESEEPEELFALGREHSDESNLTEDAFQRNKTRKRVSTDHEHWNKRAKTLNDKTNYSDNNTETTTPARPLGEHKAAPVTEESTAKHSVSLESVRKVILGRRIARSLARGGGGSGGEAAYCFGRIISVMRGETLDDDLYRVSYEDGGKEDLNTLTLFGTWAVSHVLGGSAPLARTSNTLCSFLFDISIYADAVLLYWKIVPDFADTGGKQSDPELLADWLFQHSDRVRRFKYMLFEKERASIDGFRVMKVGDDAKALFGTIMEYGPDDSSEWTAAGEHDSLDSGDTEEGLQRRHVWTVCYDNGEIEQMDTADLKEGIEAYNVFERDDPTPVNMDHIGMHQAYLPGKLLL